jgi:hypothetical protein
MLLERMDAIDALRVAKSISDLRIMVHCQDGVWIVTLQINNEGQSIYQSLFNVVGLML